MKTNEITTLCGGLARSVCKMSDKKKAKLAIRREKAGKAAVTDDLPLVDTRSKYCRRVRMKIAFDGSKFHGWMCQPNLRTIQEVLQSTTRGLFAQRVRLVPAGRTDAGVHALAQICQFDALIDEIPAKELIPHLNSLLPDDIAVTSAEYTDPSFNVMSTIWKRYVYRLPGGPEKVHALCLTAIGNTRSTVAAATLSIESMQEAALYLTGTHDFAGLQSRGGRQSTVRTIYRCSVVSYDDEGLIILMEGDGFLYNMCRIVVGTLVEVGLGLQMPSHVKHILESGDRADAGPTMPADGLCLEHVEHDREWNIELSMSLPVLGHRPAIDKLRRGCATIESAPSQSST